MARRSIVVVLLAVGGLLLVAAVGLGIVLLTGGALFGGTAAPLDAQVAATVEALSAQEMTPPASLEELTSEYPELAPLLGDPELGSIYKEFLLAYQEGGVEAATALAKQRGALTPDGQSLRVTLVLDTEDSQPLADELTALGIEVVSVYRDRINIAVPVALIEAAMTSDEIESVFKALTELDHVIAVRLPNQRGSNQQSDVGEGVQRIGADAWHAAGFTGQGMRIGILDLGFAGHEALLGTELPASVAMATFGWYDGAEVHGTACAEIVHELAPDAELFFAWYDGSDAAMGEGVAWLLEQQVHIISHSAGGVLSPRDGTGWDARLVDDVAAQGVLWVNSAGNEAQVHYRDTFTDNDGDGFHDFQPDVSLLPIYTMGAVRIYLLWQDVWDQPTQDIELVLVDGNGDVIAASEDAQSGEAGQLPVEWIALEGDEGVIYATVYAYAVDQPVVFDIFALGPGVEVAGAVAEYSVASPGDAHGALTVGAVEWQSDMVAPYSSQGPTTDGRLKPEISGPAGVSGVTYGQGGFDGTSASAPHVAGAAALVWAAYPDFTREDLVDFLLGSATDLGPAGADTAYGFGRLVLPPPPQAVVAPGTPLPVTPSAPSTGTPVAYVTPVPASSEVEEGRDFRWVFAFLVGGLGLGGIGMVVVGLALFIGGRRSRPQSLPGMPPGAPSSYPAAEPDRGHAAALPSTELWLGDLQKPDQNAGQERLPPPAPHIPAPSADPSLHCPACHAPLPPDARFCGVCGAAVAPAPVRICPHCGASLRNESRFCPQCGKPTARTMHER